MQAPVILNLLFIASPVSVDIISEERVIYKIELYNPLTYISKCGKNAMYNVQIEIKICKEILKRN
ncbi:MAG: hypothetical protein QG657_5024 [Acidobacteriota bacterium]|nr:hypothetical protein [Acidobacteriota bacterium]